MKWWDNQLNNALNIMMGHDKSEPFHLHLRRHLKQLRAGSKDRRTISNLCFNALRLSVLLKELDMREQMIIANALLYPEWTDQINHYVNGLSAQTADMLREIASQDVEARFRSYCELKSVTVNAAFPYTDQVSEAIDIDEFVIGHLKAKDLFIWCKKRSIESIKSSLSENQIAFNEIEGLTDALRLPANTDLKKILGRDSDRVEVQDISSQLALNSIELGEDDVVWDCCAGSGGKSMHLADRDHGPIWLVSDKRGSIQHNLKRRMGSVTKYFAQAELDLLTQSEDYAIFNKPDKSIYELGPQEADTILVDAPCTGSGTWARNPDQMGRFKEEKIERFASVQLAILKSVWKFLKPGGQLRYMTCSVYREENEQIAAKFQSSVQDCTIESTAYFGDKHQGDRLFMAHLTKK